MVVCLVAYMVQETVTLAVIENPEKEEDLNPLMIFVYMLAESLFLGLLLLISTGWHITRNNLKDRKFLFWFPPLHFASSAGYAYIVADVPLEDELLVVSCLELLLSSPPHSCNGFLQKHPYQLASVVQV